MMAVDMVMVCASSSVKSPRTQVTKMKLMERIHGCLLRKAYCLVVGILLVLCDRTRANSPYPCPVKLEPNHTNYCECNILMEIHCYNLDSIPEFVTDGREYLGIYMENQDIKNVPSSSFMVLAVRKISLNYNPFGDVISVNAFTGMERTLEELHLAQCRISLLADNLLVSQDKLKALHLWGNEIERIPDGFFRSNRDLRELSLWGNKIKHLNSNSFAGLWKLKKLDLDNNRISSLNEEIFRHLGNLETLYLGGNNINTINSNTFKHMTSLKLLRLDNNGLKYTYENTFRGLENLQILGLQHNQLNFIHDDIFVMMSNLTMLWLQHNQLEFLWGRNFDKLEKLRELHLSHNHLSKLHDRLFRNNRELTHLFVDHNQLTTLRKCTFPRKPRLKILSVVGNPMNCDCRLSWIVGLSRKGTSIWGSCLPNKDPAEKLNSIIDDVQYNECAHSSEDCPRQ